MKEMILDNAKNEGKLYIMQDLLQDSKSMASWNMREAVILCISAIQPAYADRNHAPSLSCVPLEK